MKTFNFKPERIYIVLNNNIIFIGDYEEWPSIDFLIPQHVKFYRNILNRHIMYLLEIQDCLVHDEILFISHSKKKFEKYLKKHEKELV